MLVLSCFFFLAASLAILAGAQAVNSVQVQPCTLTTKSESKQALAAQITSRPVLELRDVSSICGYWSSVGITYTVGCDNDIPCVFSSIAPGSIFGFCTHSGVQVITTGYDYDAYPAGGCQPGQLCCNSAQPSYGEFVFDNGASTFFQCSTSRFDIAAVNAIATSASTTTTSSTLSSTPTTSSSTSDSPTTFSFGPGSPSSTSPSNSDSTSGTNSNGDSNPANTSDVSGSSSKLSTGAIVGIAIGAGAIIVLLALGIFCCLKRRKRNRASNDTYLQMYPASAAAGAGIDKPATLFRDNPNPPTYDNEGFTEKQYVGHGTQGVGGSQPENMYWNNGPTAHTHMLREGYTREGM